MSILSTIGYKSHTNYSFFKKVDSIINCLSNRVLLKPDPFAFQLLALRFLHVLASKVPRLAIFFIISALFCYVCLPMYVRGVFVRRGPFFARKPPLMQIKRRHRHARRCCCSNFAYIVTMQYTIRSFVSILQRASNQMVANSITFFAIVHYPLALALAKKR